MIYLTITDVWRSIENWIQVVKKFIGFWVLLRTRGMLLTVNKPNSNLIHITISTTKKTNFNNRMNNKHTKIHTKKIIFISYSSRIFLYYLSTFSWSRVVTKSVKYKSLLDEIPCYTYPTHPTVQLYSEHQYKNDKANKRTHIILFVCWKNVWCIKCMKIAKKKKTQNNT